ncbi:MAG: alpha/beta hydrolase [Gemmatimonadetes bacterium]|nr:alpha/beta hydrolase [Gemmatimonadota bacterium]MBI3569098.1 alpha/beta hydrolase [Gemmatimonadota bacterium]
MTDFIRLPVGPGALHVERFGFGDRAVVLLHGFGTSGFLWRNVAPALRLGEVTAYAVDLFGHGESDRDSDADLGVRAQAMYLDQALTLLRVASADVVAVDFGAAVALALAARRASRVRSLVLVNPPDPAALRGADLAELARLQARHLLEASRGMMGARLLLGPLLEKSVADPARMPEALVGRYLAPFVGGEGVRHLGELSRAVNDRALDGVDWGSVAVPTLVVRGDADDWVPPTVSAALASRLQQGELRRVPGAARLVPEDAPEAMAALVTEWIARTALK